MSSLFADCGLAFGLDGEGIIFLKKMLEDTKTSAEPNAQRSPVVFDAETSKVQASITPKVKGRSEMYVLGEYETPNNRAYAATVKSGDRA